jgi:hypothetical protein
VVLRVRGSTGSLGKLTLQRDCGVSWRYQAIALIDPRPAPGGRGFECNRDLTRGTRAFGEVMVRHGNLVQRKHSAAGEGTLDISD